MIESEETDIEEITVWVCMNNNRFGKRVIMVVAWIKLVEGDEQEEGDSSGYKESNVFHCGLLVGCHSNPSVFQPSACHIHCFASCRLKCGIIGRYQQTFVGRLFSAVTTSLVSANSFLYNMQSFGHA